MSKRRIQLSLREKVRLKNKLGNECVYCGCRNKLLLTLDHSIPLSRGGGETQENKKVCCCICNFLKGQLTDKEFVKYYKALNDLYDLAKIKFRIGTNSIEFLPTHYPEFISSREKKDIKVLDSKKDNGEYKKELWEGNGKIVPTRQDILQTPTK